MPNLDPLKKDIQAIISKSEIREDLGHSKNTLKWLLKLCPEASVELQIAALSHDIERGMLPRVSKRKGESYYARKQRHARRSAKIIAKIMEKHGFKKKSINKTKGYISNHEIGGDRLTNCLRDADSISYFDYNLVEYSKRHSLKVTGQKMTFMYKRSSPRAQKIIQGLKFSKDIKRMFKTLMHP